LIDTEVYDLQKVALNMDFIGDISYKQMHVISVGGCDNLKKINELIENLIHLKTR
jgi:hypothetical protein